MIKNNITTGIYLDTRRELKDCTYPVKLRITANRKSQLFKTPFSLTEKEFEKLTSKGNPRGELKDIKLKLGEIENEAKTVIEKLPFFSFELFKIKFFEIKGDTNDLFYYFVLKIKELEKEDRLGTAETYKCALISIQKYHNKKTLDLNLLTPDFFKNYEKWMVSNRKSLGTVGIYLRNVKHLFNRAIQEDVIGAEQYPFGRNKYQIPEPKNIKRALPLIEIKSLYEYEPENGSIEHMYRDLWFFSYLCNGINMKDICSLKYKDIQGDHIYFNRNKTRRYIRNRKPIDVIITDEVEAIMNRWGTKTGNPEDYIFPFFTNDYDEKTKRKKLHQANKNISKYIRRIEDHVGIEKNISSIWARHSFATVLKRSGIGQEIISEQMGHADLKTTQNYLDSFEDETKRDVAKKLLDFS